MSSNETSGAAVSVPSHASLLTEVELGALSFQDLTSRFLDLQSTLQSHQSQTKADQKQLELSKKREAELVIRLTQREKDIYSLETTIKELKEAGSKKAMRMRTTFMDPLINENYRVLLNELAACKKQLVTVQEDLKATEFNPNTIIGRQLMAKCRKLQEENEEFGRKLSEGKIHQLQTELANQKVYADELLKDLEDQREVNELLDTEVEQMQQTINRLRKAYTELERVHRECERRRESDVAAATSYHRPDQQQESEETTNRSGRDEFDNDPRSSDPLDAVVAADVDADADRDREEPSRRDDYGDTDMTRREDEFDDDPDAVERERDRDRDHERGREHERELSDSEASRRKRDRDADQSSPRDSQEDDDSARAKRTRHSPSYHQDDSVGDAAMTENSS